MQKCRESISKPTAGKMALVMSGPGVRPAPGPFRSCPCIADAQYALVPVFPYGPAGFS